MEVFNTMRDFLVFLLFRLAILRRGENQFTCHIFMHEIKYLLELLLLREYG